MGDYRAPRFLPLGALPSEGSRSARVAAELGARPRAVVLRPIPTSVVHRPGAVEALREEVRLQAATPAPHLLRVLDVEALDDGWYTVEEHADGISLAALRDGARARGKTVPPLVLARLVADACEGLAAVASPRLAPAETSPRAAELAVALHVGFDGIARIVPGAVGWPERWPGDPARAMGDLLRAELAAAEEAGAARAPETLRAVADGTAREPGDLGTLRAALLRALAGGALAGPGYVKHLLADLVPMDAPPRLAARQLRAALATLEAPLVGEEAAVAEPGRPSASTGVAPGPGRNGAGGLARSPAAAAADLEKAETVRSDASTTRAVPLAAVRIGQAFEEAETVTADASTTRAVPPAAGTIGQAFEEAQTVPADASTTRAVPLAALRIGEAFEEAETVPADALTTRAVPPAAGTIGEAFEEAETLPAHASTTRAVPLAALRIGEAFEEAETVSAHASTTRAVPPAAVRVGEAFEEAEAVLLVEVSTPNDVPRATVAIGEVADAARAVLPAGASIPLAHVAIGESAGAPSAALPIDLTRGAAVTGHTDDGSGESDRPGSASAVPPAEEPARAAELGRPVSRPGFRAAADRAGGPDESTPSTRQTMRGTDPSVDVVRWPARRTSVGSGPAAAGEPGASPSSAAPPASASAARRDPPAAPAVATGPSSGLRPGGADTAGPVPPGATRGAAAAGSPAGAALAPADERPAAARSGPARDGSSSTSPTPTATPRPRAGPWPFVAAALGGAFLTLAAVHVADRPAAPPVRAEPSGPAGGAAGTSGPSAAPSVPLAVPGEPPARVGAGGNGGGGGAAASPASTVREKAVAAPRARPRPPRLRETRPAPVTAAGAATVEIRAPAGSRVEIDGADRGIAPFAAPLPISDGPHLVRVTLGRGVYDTRLSARAGEDYTLDVTFVGNL